MQDTNRIKTAVFVDFDNVYINLLNVNPQSAERFATDPLRWLRWLESGAYEGNPQPARRAILIRRCYLNPTATGFGNYRAYFSRNAFSVIDCPPVTSRGKNSADIVMVMDILDTLTHTTRIDEFIILSADADFTPVLLRLRAHDRRTAIWSSRFSAAAYRAACDSVIDQNIFVEEALGIEARAVFPSPTSMAPAAGGRDGYGALLPGVAGALADQARSSGPVASRDVHEVLRRFPQFTNSSWFGFGNLRSLVEHLCILLPGLELRTIGEADWRVEWKGAGSPAAGSDLAGLDDAALKSRIMAAVRAELRASDRPVALAALGQTVTRTMGHWVKEQRQWAGHGTLKALIVANGGPDIGIDVTGTGYAFDRTRHRPPAAPDAANQPTETEAEELRDFIGRIASITDMPPLPADTYAKLFRAIGDALEREPYQDQLALESQVSAICADGGLDVDKAAISYVVTGLAMSDFNFTEDEADPGAIARFFMRNAVETCANAQLTLSDRDHALFAIWLTGATWGELQPGGRGAAGAASPSSPAGIEFSTLIREVADRVLGEVTGKGTLTGLDLVSIVRQVNTWGDRSWFGCGNLRILVERIIDLHPALMVTQPTGQPWRFVLKSEEVSASGAPSNPEQAQEKSGPLVTA
ncbi:NYN domain-containing protein [Skermanella pratensis]|uniref:NYN domain-containing protein n=1 Tax=Skermanella pratensis TaxID=2233999 RepID=UPI0017877DE9|nr:NYN domain-containing protein [Skermanella pratensis]